MTLYQRVGSCDSSSRNLCWFATMASLTDLTPHPDGRNANARAARGGGRGRARSDAAMSSTPSPSAWQARSAAPAWPDTSAVPGALPSDRAVASMRARCHEVLDAAYAAGNRHVDASPVDTGWPSSSSPGWLASAGHGRDVEISPERGATLGGD